MKSWGLLGFCALVALVQSSGDFLSTCHDVKVDSGTEDPAAFNDFVSATCQTMDNKSRAATMDLNLCVGFDATAQKLTWSPMGKFRNSCSSCTFNQPEELQCTCGVDSHTSTLQLSDGIANRDGALACVSWDNTLDGSR